MKMNLHLLKIVRGASKIYENKYRLSLVLTLKERQFFPFAPN